jgi:hypothetical protein
MSIEPTENEKAQLAREIAADLAVGCAGGYNAESRRVFMLGWDAALEHVRQREQGLLLQP